MFRSMIARGTAALALLTLAFGTILDGLIQRQQAGKLDILTVSQWYARDIANPAIPPVGFGLDVPKQPAIDNGDRKAAA